MPASTGSVRTIANCVRVGLRLCGNLQVKVRTPSFARFRLPSAPAYTATSLMATLPPRETKTNELCAENRSFCSALTLAVGCLGFIGCGNAPGRPGPGPEVVVLEECSISLDSTNELLRMPWREWQGRPGDLALQSAVHSACRRNPSAGISQWRSRQLMPPFAKSAGGMLTDSRLNAGAGYSKAMGQSGHSRRQNSSAYWRPAGQWQHGLETYGVFCARCHGTRGRWPCRRKAKLDQGQDRIDH